MVVRECSSEVRQPAERMREELPLRRFFVLHVDGEARRMCADPLTALGGKSRDDPALCSASGVPARLK